MMNWLNMKLSGALAAIVAAVTATASAAEPVEWTMTTVFPSSLEHIEMDKIFLKNVETVAGDNLDITFHEGGSLVPSFEVFDIVSAGDVCAGGDWPGYWSGRSPAFSPLATHASLFNAVDMALWIYEWGGLELYNEVYGQYGMVYLPYAVHNNEAGFRTNEPLRSLEDLKGKRLRLSGLEQGLLLEKLGGEQVRMAGQEIYQALERGVLDGAEFATPGIDFAAGFAEVTDYWSVPGWHQSNAVFGVMINKDCWNSLDEGVQAKVEVAARASMMESFTKFERRSTEGVKQFQDAGVEIIRWSDEILAQVQEMALETIVEAACADKMAAKVYASQVKYLEDYADWREMSQPFSLGRNPPRPDLEAIEACM